MPDFAPITHQFITTVRRRLMFARLAESMVISSAISISLGLVLLFIQVMRGESEVGVSEAIVFLGLVTGIGWGIARRPTALQAALEADRQLDLDDLLSTVLVMGLTRPADFPSGLPSMDSGRELVDRSLRVEDSRHVPSSDVWRDTIGAFSDTRCSSLRPGQVIVNRLGMRAFAGVGILAGLLFSLSFLTATPSSVDAASPSRGISTHLFDLQKSSDLEASRVGQGNVQMGRPPGPGGVDAQPTRISEKPQTSLVDDGAGAKQLREIASGNVADAQASGDGLGNARGGSQINDRARIAPLGSENSAEKRGDLNGAGDGAASGETAASGTSGSGVVAKSNRAQDQIPPWKSDSWKSDGDAAERAVRSGDVSGEDADLVRDYFRRD